MCAGVSREWASGGSAALFRRRVCVRALSIFPGGGARKGGRWRARLIVDRREAGKQLSARALRESVTRRR